MNDRVRMVYKITIDMRWDNENVDELVAEVFIAQNGYVMTCPIEHVFTTAKYAILNYHTKITGGTHDKKRVKQSTQLTKKRIANPLPAYEFAYGVIDHTLNHEDIADAREIFDIYVEMQKTRYQEILKWVLLYGRTYRDVAKIVGCSLSTVCLVVRKAKREMKKLGQG
jgi:DNA-directed RNA polymerase specialized sigma24 family protein